VPGWDCRGRGPGSSNQRGQYGWPLLLPFGVSHCRAEGWLLLWEGQVCSIEWHFSVMSVSRSSVRHACRARTILLSLTQHYTSTACVMKVVRPPTNEEGCLWAQNTVTPHQFYAVPGNKMGILIFRLSYVLHSECYWSSGMLIHRQNLHMPHSQRCTGHRKVQCRELVKWVKILTVFMYVIKPTESGGRKLCLFIIKNKRFW
jgi:hypothetical protein